MYKTYRQHIYTFTYNNIQHINQYDNIYIYNVYIYIPYCAMLSSIISLTSPQMMKVTEYDLGKRSLKIMLCLPQSPNAIGQKARIITKALLIQKTCETQILDQFRFFVCLSNFQQNWYNGLDLNRLRSRTHYTNVKFIIFDPLVKKTAFPSELLLFQNKGFFKHPRIG